MTDPIYDGPEYPVDKDMPADELADGDDPDYPVHDDDIHGFADIAGAGDLVKVPEDAPAAPAGAPDVVVPAVVTPTQVRRPWRATVRTVFQAVLALCIMAPFLAQAAGLDAKRLPLVGGFLVVAAAITRVMALPQVEDFLRRFVPFLAAAPKP